MNVVRDYIQDKGHNVRGLGQPLSEISLSVRTCVHLKPLVKAQWVKCDKPSMTVLGAHMCWGVGGELNFCLLTFQPPKVLARAQFETSSGDQISFSKGK